MYVVLTCMLSDSSGWMMDKRLYVYCHNNHSSFSSKGLTTQWCVVRRERVNDEF